MVESPCVRKRNCTVCCCNALRCKRRAEPTSPAGHPPHDIDTHECLERYGAKTRQYRASRQRQFMCGGASCIGAAVDISSRTTSIDPQKLLKKYCDTAARTSRCRELTKPGQKKQQHSILHHPCQRYRPFRSAVSMIGRGGQHNRVSASPMDSRSMSLSCPVWLALSVARHQLSFFGNLGVWKSGPKSWND